MVEKKGLEPSTSRLQGERSSKLNYFPMVPTRGLEPPRPFSDHQHLKLGRLPFRHVGIDSGATEMMVRRVHRDLNPNGWFRRPMLYQMSFACVRHRGGRPSQGERTRTSNLVRPRHVLYQVELHPEVRRHPSSEIVGCF